MVEVSDIPAILRRRLRWIILVPVLLTGLAVLFAMTRAPAYTASAELLVEPPSLQILGREFSGREGASPLEGFDVDSQAFVLMSTPVLDRVVTSLELENDPAFSGKGLRQTLLPFLFSAPDPAGRRMAVIEALRKRLQVQRIEKTFIFQIAATHPNPDRAADIANATAAAYLEEAAKARSEGFQRTSQSLKTQADQLQAQVQQAEAAVEKYRAENGLISTSQGGLVVNQQLQDLNTQLTQARVDLEKAKNTFELIRRLSPSDIEAGAIPVDVANTVLSSLRLQYANLAEQEARASTTLGANHPQMREIAAQIQNTRRQISDELSRVQRNIRSDFERAQANLAGLETRIDQLKSANSTQSQAQIELRQLEAEADTQRGVYQLFLKRAQELAEQQNVTATNSRILSAAQPPLSANGPSSVIIIAAAAIFGLAAAAGGAVAAEIVSGRLNSERDLVDWTGAPILTNLPVLSPSPARKLLGRRGGSKPPALLNEVQMCMTRVAYALRYALSEELPANILILRTSDMLDTRPVARGIAEALHEMNEDVLLAQALPQSEQSMPEDRPKARKGELARSTGEPPERNAALSRYLSVERVNERRKYAGPASLMDEGQDFLLIDCGPSESNPILPVLLKNCDAIVLVSQLGATRMTDLDRVLAYIQPWQDRVIGNVVLEAA
ncbi:GumC family protein [Pannonibacter phragmitetus]|uniref:GumC family protein n=1 Tax=Pannonibacter phragmitetus TaxID=121719 RepID=UPI003D2EB2D0